MKLEDIYYQYWNERDLEIPALLEFIHSHKDIVTALDVGAHYSWNYYASKIRGLLPNYDAIDILPDEKTKIIVDKYTVGNVLNIKNVQYDFVFSISSIEHAGISTYSVSDYKTEQLNVFRKILELSKKYVFMTFPFGQEALHEGEFANITQAQLNTFLSFVPGSHVEVHFYYSEFPQGKNPYMEVDMFTASQIEYKRELGTRCVCFLYIEKGG